jgi:hypothetical protein
VSAASEWGGLGAGVGGALGADEEEDEDEVPLDDEPDDDDDKGTLRLDGTQGAARDGVDDREGMAARADRDAVSEAVALAGGNGQGPGDALGTDRGVFLPLRVATPAGAGARTGIRWGVAKDATELGATAAAGPGTSALTGRTDADDESLDATNFGPEEDPSTSGTGCFITTTPSIMCPTALAHAMYLVLTLSVLEDDRRAGALESIGCRTLPVSLLTSNPLPVGSRLNRRLGGTNLPVLGQTISEP